MGDDDSLESVDGQTAGGDRMSMMLAAELRLWAQQEGHDKLGGRASLHPPTRDSARLALGSCFLTMYAWLAGVQSTL
jgi:hypothetical protein